MKAIELFAGVGGFRLGLERNGHTVVWANEWDKYAAATYDRNFTDGHIDTRSITDVPASEIPAHDIICGGFPCQAFSIAGKRRGFDETRGTLFFDIMRIARHHRTPYLFLENVKGLLNHDQGRTFGTILEALDELGYDCQWQVLNSKDFGVPQNRERVFIVGHLRDRPRPQVFPIGEGQVGVTESGDESTNRLVSNAIDSSYYKGPDGKRTIIRIDNNAPHYQDRVYGDDGISPTLPTAATGGNLIPKILDGRIRRLTPRECERLQGFPDGWTEGVSDTQRYKQMGNAVTVNVIQAIAERLPN